MNHPKFYQAVSQSEKSKCALCLFGIKRSKDWRSLLTGENTTMNRKLIHAISVVSKANPGVPVLLADLRKRLPGMSKSSFDKAILNLAQSGEYFLTRHFYPGNSTEQEKELMIPDGAGNFFIAINPLFIDRSPGKVGVSPPIEKKQMPEELKPSKRGRIPVPEHLEAGPGSTELPAG